MSEDQHQSAERQSFLELTRSIAGLPLDQAAAVLETSAAIAAISLRAGIEFLRAAPAAAHILQPANCDRGERWAGGSQWRITNRRSHSSPKALKHFATFPPELRPAIFVLCTRQMILSTAVGRETLHSLPSLVAEID